ncbi:primosomal protein N' [Slackia sp.]|uniref:replication restart helicase PriA n=2 Tax=Slackia TaxID=84108 RepID=UPI00261B0907|nr:primosomal protein N' [Slackia sp.]
MRTVSVVLDIQTQALDSSYTYVVPEEMDDIAVGCAVLVEFGRRRAVGYVMEIAEENFDLEGNVDFSEPADAQVERLADASASSKLKPVLAVLSAPYFDEDGAALIEYIATTYIAPLSACVHLLTPVGRTPKVQKKGDSWELQKPARRRKKDAGDFTPLSDEEISRRARALESFELTQGQAKAFALVSECLHRGCGEVALIDGVTGSGKTEVYLRAIRACLEKGCGALVLVPEIALTPQTVSRFEGRFGRTVAVMHSRMTAGERFDQWEAVRQGEKRVVVGARSALFCPMERLGLIIIDEEHENTYKQESAPRYHARDVAAWMAKRHGAALVLGSATPSIESLCRCKADPLWHRIALPERANGKPLPEVDVIDMAKEFSKGSRSMFSRSLTEALFRALDAGRKAVLLLNQRGFANFVLCRDCGYVPECPTCSVSLTYHERGNKLVCHHCGRQTPAMPTCPVCGSPYLKKFGAGTQRVETELRKLLEDRPQTDIIRMDADTTATRDAHERLLRQFGKPGPAVLLGTQMIAKGLDFNDVVLVGVINADTQLKLPDFRSAERTFALIEQVAGRAGRGDFEGRVLVQTYLSESCAIQSAAAYDRKRFLLDELPKRKLLRYPPYARLANILVWGDSSSEVREVAQALAARVDEVIRDVVGQQWESLGAAPCAIERLRGHYRWHILIKAPADADISAAITPVIRKRRAHKSVNVACDVDPVSLL